MVAVAGVTTMLLTVAGSVVAWAVALLPTAVAVSVDVPAATPVMTPAALTDTKAGLADANTLLVVTSTIVPSEYVASTRSWRVAPIWNVVAAGVRASETTVAGKTVSDAVAVRPADAALTAVVPVTLPIARPAASIVAVAGVATLKVDAAVTSRVVLLSKLPITAYCSVAPIFTVEIAGTSAMLVSLAGRTVIVALPLLPSNAALMMAVPALTPVATPAAFTLEIVALADVHAAATVTSRAEPSV